jgi:penicillin-binding protein 2
MKFEDDTQNLKARMTVINGLVLAILAVLGARLYFLQVVNGDYYAERAENQRVRRLKIPAPRGAIFDRNGKLLVDSRSTYNIILSGEDMKGKNLGEFVEPLADGLGVAPDILRERFDQAGRQAAFEEITVKEGADPADLAWVEAHTLEMPMLLVREQPQRRYPENGVLAHVLGYVGEISPEQLKQPRFKDPEVNPFVKDNPYHSGDIIGQEGLEATYDKYLRGRDGYREVEVDSRGRIQRELDVKRPQPGQDIVTTIDLDLQLAAEEQLRNSPNKRGVIVVMNPQNGEILVMASYPTFDPNLFSQRISTPEGRAEARKLLLDPLFPLYNRAIRGRYPPGSTWKILMATAGLQQGAITLKNSHLVCGGGIQIGNKFTRCMGSHGSPELRTAIRVSCDGYFYRLGLKMGLDGIMQMVDEFDLNKKTGVDLPHELISWTPSREFKARFTPKGGDPTWKDIDTVYASFGQVYDFVTPLAMLRAQSAVANGGRLYVPHLLLEAKPVSAVGDTFKARERQTFEHPDPTNLNIPADQNHLVVDGMWAVVNEAGGTGGAARVEGFDVAGKTGTAQVVGLGKDTGKNKDHSWFVSYAPAFKPEISMIALIENVGFGGKFAAPAVHNIYNAYLSKTRPELAPKASSKEVAKKQ